MNRLDSRFQAFIESAPDAIVVNREGWIVGINALTEEMFGYTREELLDQRVEILVPERFRAHHENERDADPGSPRTPPMGLDRQLWGRRKSGQEFPVEMSLSPLVTDQERMVMSSIRDITERRRADEVIRTSLREKEALLREIHHRVKNNLQVTSSLLRLQASAIGDESARGMFAETENRIRSMALVHEKLYQSSTLSRIDFGDYIRSLGDLLIHSSGITRDVTLDVSGEGISLDIEKAVPCGLIVNELLSNALKHAFPDGRHGQIHVHLDETEDGAIQVSVRDDGVGLPAAFDATCTDTLGLQLVHALVQQLDGAITIERGHPGARFSFIFPAESVH